MTAQDLFLGLVIIVYAAFIITLGGVSLWVNLSGDKRS